MVDEWREMSGGENPAKINALEDVFENWSGKWTAQHPRRYSEGWGGKACWHSTDSN